MLITSNRVLLLHGATATSRLISTSLPWGRGMYESTSISINYVTHMYLVGFILAISQQYKYHPGWRVSQNQQYSTIFFARRNTSFKMEEETTNAKTLKYVDV